MMSPRKLWMWAGWTSGALCALSACGGVDPSLQREDTVVLDAATDEGKADAPGDLVLRPLDGLPVPVLTAGEVRRVLRTAADFRRVFGVDAAPWLDFAQEWVALYDAGPRRSGGFDAFVMRVRLSESRATVMVTTRLVSPGDGCAVTLALTRPFAVVAFRRPMVTGEGRTSRFYKDDRVSACGVAREGEDCDASRTCQTGLRCNGTPGDGSGYVGKCAPIARPAGSGALCSAQTTCGAGLFCNRYGPGAPDGECAPLWMRGAYSVSRDQQIPDGAPDGVASPLVVYGLATVPTSAWVSFDIEHARRRDISVHLVNPLGTEVVVHKRTPTSRLANLTRVRAPIWVPGDEPVNGRWTLRVIDHRAGTAGTLKGWALELESRWD